MKIITNILIGLSLLTATAQAVEIVKLGVVAPLTGPQAHQGKDIENGARLAIDEINSVNPTLDGKSVRFELLVEDDQADPRTATVVAQKLVDNGIKGVIGHLNSGASIPAARIYAEAGIPQVSPSTTAVAYTQQGFKTTYRVMANDAQQGHALGEYAVRIGQRVAVVDDRTTYGQGLADEVIKAVQAGGGMVVAREFTTDKSTDFTAILTSLKAKRPDVLFYGGMDPQAAPMARQMKMLGLKAVFMGGDGTQTTEFLKLAGTAAEGIIASSPGLPLEKMPGGKEFAARFNARFGKIQLYAPFAYDASRVLIAAIREANSAEPARYLPKLAQIAFDGITGAIAFDVHGDIKNGPITLYQVKNNQWVPLTTIGGKN
ncbi:branched-chain amino acid transport system substrate-binding protein [Gammaproteobacteria bacterium]